MFSYTGRDYRWPVCRNALPFGRLSLPIINCGGYRLQPAATEVTIGFEIGAFGPLIPRVDDDHAVAALLALMENRATKPAPKIGRRGTVENKGTRAPARRIVPARHHTP